MNVHKSGTTSSAQQCLSLRPQRERRGKESAGDKQWRESKGEELYQVEAVIGERTVHHMGGESMTQVLVLWHDYGIERASWEPILNIPSEFVDRFKGGELPDPDFFDDDAAGIVENDRGGDENQGHIEGADKGEDQGHAPQLQYGEEEEEAEASSTRYHGRGSRYWDEEDNDDEEDRDYSVAMDDGDKDNGTAGSERSADGRGMVAERRSQVAALFVGVRRQHEVCAACKPLCTARGLCLNPASPNLVRRVWRTDFRIHARAHTHAHTHTHTHVLMRWL